ncbi:MAG: hypothetical protein IH840_02615 [Candidatus Heimdallarchaeota archaeon]|nr:hypothetical protein [Candidatus Heimdallarchaeota archaeon]
MGRKRIVKTYKDTRAKGDRSRIEGHRYLVRVDLVSIKMEKEADSVGATSEIYIHCPGRFSRTPNEGTFNIERNEVFKPTGGITVYSRMREKKGGETVEISFKVFDQDLGRDDKLVDTKLSITLGQSKEYISFIENGVKVKISVAANHSRF